MGAAPHDLETICVSTTKPAGRLPELKAERQRMRHPMGGQWRRDRARHSRHVPTEHTIPARTRQVSSNAENTRRVGAFGRGGSAMTIVVWHRFPHLHLMSDASAAPTGLWDPRAPA
eukprot:101588-Rhodomonas_salina.2